MSVYPLCPMVVPHTLRKHPHRPELYCEVCGNLKIVIGDAVPMPWLDKVIGATPRGET